MYARVVRPFNIAVRTSTLKAPAAAAVEFRRVTDAVIVAFFLYPGQSSFRAATGDMAQTPTSRSASQKRLVVIGNTWTWLVWYIQNSGVLL